MLKLDRVGVHDDFFESGGDSLAAVRMMAQARAALGVPVPIAVFFATPTVAALAAHFERALLSASDRAPKPRPSRSESTSVPCSLATLSPVEMVRTQ